MSWLDLAEISALSGGTLHGENRMVDGVSSDTRRLHRGELFVALRGQRFDGHDFVSSCEAGDRGAAAAMVDRRIDVSLPQILVGDTLEGLTALSAAWRKRCQPICVALTGSNGKTTTREMIVSILGLRWKIASSEGNLNNHIGVPLTLLSLRTQHRVAVVELGASGPHEITHLARLAAPQVALVLNAGEAHLEGFGSLDGVAQAKGELFECLEEGGVGVVNADDAYCDYWCGLLKGCSIVRFGIDSGGRNLDVAGRLEGHGAMTMTIAGETRSLRLNLPGRYNACNALAAAAVAHSLHVGFDDIVAGLEKASAVPGRLFLLKGMGGSQLIDDSYNANPTSFAASLSVLEEHPGERWLVMGDMGELGASARRFHVGLGQIARRRKVSRLFACGELSLAAVESFGAGGKHFGSQESLSRHLVSRLGKGDHSQVTILVKGSRSARMEHVVQMLQHGSTGWEMAAC